MHVVSSSHLLNAALHVLKLISIIWSGIKFLSIGRSNFAGSENIENDRNVRSLRVWEQHKECQMPMPLFVDSRGNASLNFVIPEMKKVFTTKSVKNMIETKRFSLKKKIPMIKHTKSIFSNKL
jgi:hypothetical protein